MATIESQRASGPSGGAGLAAMVTAGDAFPGDAAPAAAGASVATGSGAEQVTRTRIPGLTPLRLAAADGATRSVRSPVLRLLAFATPAGTSPSRSVMLGAAVSIVTTSTAIEGPAGDGAAATVVGGGTEAVEAGGSFEPPQAAGSRRRGIRNRRFMALSSREARGDAPRVSLLRS